MLAAIHASMSQWPLSRLSRPAYYRDERQVSNELPAI
jgi:hypothetical protein